MLIIWLGVMGTFKVIVSIVGANTTLALALTILWNLMEIFTVINLVLIALSIYYFLMPRQAKLSIWIVSFPSYLIKYVPNVLKPHMNKKIFTSLFVYVVGKEQQLSNLESKWRIQDKVQYV
jgi:hypothetical protein